MPIFNQNGNSSFVIEVYPGVLWTEKCNHSITANKSKVGEVNEWLVLKKLMVGVG